MRNHMTLAGLLALAAVASPAAAQTIAITGGTVYPVSGPAIQGGTVLIRNGKIAAVGGNVTIPADAERVDATGKSVTPGFINSATLLGVAEVSGVGETRQFSASGGDDQVAAAFRVWDSFNPASVLLAPTRNDGVTTALVVPQGGLVAGQAALTDLAGDSTEAMLRRAPAAMVAQVGDPQEANTTAKGELLVRLRELLEDTRAFMQRRSAYESGNTRRYAASRLDLEAMIPVVQGRLPLLVMADQARDIQSVLDLATEYDVRVIIAGGAEAWKVADRLAAARVPVLTGAMNNIPMSFASLGQRQNNAALLREAGVTVAIIGNAGGGDEETFNARNVRLEAGNAIAYGLSREDALRAVTMAPAEIFGAGNAIGALRPGMDANVVVWSGDPFETTTRAEAVFIKGKRQSEPSRQDLLIQRYRNLPPAYTKPQSQD